MNDLHPSNINDCEALHDLLPAYAFGFSDQEEVETVERLLPRCPDAAAELAEYRALSERYLSSTPLVEPPAHLLTNILQAAQPRKPVIRISWVMVAAAALIVLLAFNIGVLTQLTRLSTTVRDQSELLTDFASDNILAFNLIAPEGVSSKAVATLHCNPVRKAAILHAENFPPANGYQVWLWRDGKRDSGGTFDVDSTGQGFSIFEAPDVMGVYQYVSIAPPEGQEPTPLVRGMLYPTPYPQ